jgi:hypothetical protein
LSQQLDKVCGNYSNPDEQCQQLLNKMGSAIGDVNVYDIYQPCINGGLSREEAVRHTRRRIPIAAGRILGGPDECIDGIAAAAYLNTAVVQQVWASSTAAASHTIVATVCSCF